MRQDVVETGRRAIAEHYPRALGGFIGGSVVRGEGTPTSDIDIVVVFGDGFEDIHRNSVVFEGWPVEFFVHNVQAQDYFMHKDRLRGMCVMPSLIADGAVVPAEHPTLAAQQRKARRIIDRGPPPLSIDEVDFRRYMITDLVDDLRGAADPGQRNAVLSLLHERLGDFHLRAASRWSGSGKALVRCLRRQDAELAERYERAFAAGFAGGSIDPIVELADRVLSAHGGKLWAGYRSPAPATWRDFDGTES